MIRKSEYWYTNYWCKGAMYTHVPSAGYKVNSRNVGSRLYLQDDYGDLVMMPLLSAPEYILSGMYFGGC